MSMRKIILPLLLMFAAPVYGADICQQSFTFRLEKGSALTHQEGDDNFRNSKDVCDWLDGVSTCSISGEFLTGFDSDGDAVCAAPATVVNITGNAGTASALAANPANCSTGNAPLGVAASGAAEGCFDVATQGEVDDAVQDLEDALAALDTSADDLSDNSLADLGTRDAADVGIADADGYYSGDDVEAALSEGGHYRAATPNALPGQVEPGDMTCAGMSGRWAVVADTDDNGGEEDWSLWRCDVTQTWLRLTPTAHASSHAPNGGDTTEAYAIPHPFTFLPCEPGHLIQASGQTKVCRPTSGLAYDQIITAATSAGGVLSGDYPNPSGLAAGVVGAAQMAAEDHGDVSWSGGVASVDSGAVGLGELADDVSCTGSQDVRRNAGDTAFECYTPSPGGIGGSTGSTDNRVLRSDGTGGATLQASKLIVADDGSVTTAAVPTDFATPVIWLKADALALNDGDAVSSWTDSSGTGNHMVQATGGLQPHYETNEVNGTLPVVRFDGGDCLADTSVALSTFSIFFVFYGHTSLGMLYEHSANVNSNDGSFIYESTNATSRVKRSGTDSARDLSATYNANPVSWIHGEQWMIATQSFGGQHRTHRFGINGFWPFTGSVTVGNPGTGTVTDEFNLGCRDESSVFFTGDMAEVIVYSPKLTSAQERAVLLYLQGKYNL